MMRNKIDFVRIVIALLPIAFSLAISTHPAPGQTIFFTREFLVSGRGSNATAIAIDSTGVYVAGEQYPSASAVAAFLCKTNASGDELWTRQFGTLTFDSANGLAVDATGVYVAATTWSDFRVGNAFLAKLEKAPAQVDESRPRIS